MSSQFKNSLNSFIKQLIKQLQKKADVNLELLTDTDMLLMVEKGIRRGICWCNSSIYKTL